MWHIITSLYQWIKLHLDARTEEFVGLCTGGLCFIHLNYYVAGVAIATKIMLPVLVGFLTGGASHLGRKISEKYFKNWFKAIGFILVLGFISSCSMSYRINKYCKVYAQADTLAGRVCVECEHNHQVILNRIVKHMDRKSSGK